MPFNGESDVTLLDQLMSNVCEPEIKRFASPLSLLQLYLRSDDARYSVSQLT